MTILADDDDISGLADRIANLTLKEAVQLSKYLEQVHGLKPSVQEIKWPDPVKDSPIEQVEFDVVLVGFNDAKLAVVKEVKSITAASLIDAKKMVESCPVKIKQKVSRQEAEDLKGKLEAAGATVSIV